VSVHYVLIDGLEEKVEELMLVSVVDSVEKSEEIKMMMLALVGKLRELYVDEADGEETAAQVVAKVAVKFDISEFGAAVQMVAKVAVKFVISVGIDNSAETSGVPRGLNGDMLMELNL
jgi:hypothetical protein